MKKIVAMVMMLALVLALTGCALGEENKVIRVTGNATVSLSADSATLQVGVNTRKETVKEAQETNAALMNAVIQAILDAGVDEKDIMTSQFDVYSVSDFSLGAAGNQEMTNYYQVSNMLSVTIRDLSCLGMVLDVAMEAGANSTYGIQFFSTQANEAYLKALTRAVEDASKKASVMADAAGKELGELILMDASQQNYYYGVTNTYNAKEDAATRTIVSGDVSVSASVVLEYRFQ